MQLCPEPPTQLSHGRIAQDAPTAVQGNLGIRAPPPYPSFRSPVSAAPQRRRSTHSEPAKIPEWFDFMTREDEAVRIYVESGLVPSWEEFQGIFEKRRAAGEPVCGRRHVSLRPTTSNGSPIISSQQTRRSESSVSNIKPDIINPSSNSPSSEPLRVSNHGDHQEVSKGSVNDIRKSVIATKTPPSQTCDRSVRSELPRNVDHSQCISEKFTPGSDAVGHSKSTDTDRNSDGIGFTLSKEFDPRKHTVPAVVSQTTKTKNIPNLLHNVMPSAPSKYVENHPSNFHSDSSLSVPEDRRTYPLVNNGVDSAVFKVRLKDNDVRSLNEKGPCHEAAPFPLEAKVLSSSDSISTLPNIKSLVDPVKLNLEINEGGVVNRQTVKDTANLARNDYITTQLLCDFCKMNIVTIPVNVTDLTNSTLRTTYSRKPVYCPPCLKTKHFILGSQQQEVIIKDGLVGPSSYHLQIINPLVNINVRYQTSEIPGNINSKETTINPENSLSKNIQNTVSTGLQPDAQSTISKKEKTALDMPVIWNTNTHPENCDTMNKRFPKADTGMNHCNDLNSKSKLHEIRERVMKKKAFFDSNVAKFGIKKCYVKVERMELPSNFKHRRSDKGKKKRTHKNRERHSKSLSKTSDYISKHYSKHRAKDKNSSKHYSKHSVNDSAKFESQNYIAYRKEYRNSSSESQKADSNVLMITKIGPKDVSRMSESINNDRNRSCESVNYNSKVNSESTSNATLRLNKVGDLPSFESLKANLDALRNTKIDTNCVPKTSENSNNDVNRSSKNINHHLKRTGESTSNLPIIKDSPSDFTLLKRNANFLKKKKNKDSKSSIHYKSGTLHSLSKSGMKDIEVNARKSENKNAHKNTSVDIKRINVELPDVRLNNCKSAVKNYQKGEIIPLGSKSENRKPLKKLPSLHGSLKPKAHQELPENITGSVFFTKPEYNPPPEKEYKSSEKERLLKTPLLKKSLHIEHRKDGSCIIRGGRKSGKLRNSGVQDANGTKGDRNPGQKDENIQKRKLEFPSNPVGVGATSKEPNKKLKLDCTTASTSASECTKLLSRASTTTTPSALTRGNGSNVSAYSMPPKLEQNIHQEPAVSPSEIKKETRMSSPHESFPENEPRNSPLEPFPSVRLENDNMCQNSVPKYKVVSVGFDLGDGSPPSTESNALLQLDLSQYPMCFKCSKCKNVFNTTVELDEHSVKCSKLTL